jgi:predicted metal-dependent enzyme (double-stranded beta helix superfamily)
MTTTTLPTGAPSRPTPGHPRLTLLAALVRDLAAQPDLWRPRVRFHAGERWWTRLDGPHGVDVWLLTWLTSQRTELHDHGGSAAAFAVVRGALTETRPGPATLRSRRLVAGQVQTVAPGDVHDVDNGDAEPAVSIHAYAPRLTRMTYYEQVAGEVRPTRTVLTDEPESAS